MTSFFIVVLSGPSYPGNRTVCVSMFLRMNPSHFPLFPHSNLVAAYEKAKKKHQNKLKKLESQMMAMVERHETQVRMLKQRIALLEEENSRPHTNETSL